MGIEMSQSGFEYVKQVTRNPQTVDAFFELIWGNQKDRPSVLYRGVMNMLKKYVEHLRLQSGDRWRYEYAIHATSLWQWYAAYILSGLYAIYGKTFPSLGSGRIEVLEKECDAPPEILFEMASKHEERLCAFGEVSRYWISHFRKNTNNYSELSHTYLCVHGIAYIYAIGAAFIAAKEDQGEDSSLSDAERHDIREREESLNPKIKAAVEEILKTMQF